MSAAEANRRFYAATAEIYDRSETCVVDPRLHAELERAIDTALRLRPAPTAVLDLCGGSGNASLLLLERGVVPLTVDISPEMLRIFERKAGELGFSPRTQIAEAASFVRDDGRLWDLVVLSSALHHLDDYEAVLDGIVRKLVPGGVLLTIYDPTSLGRSGRALRRLDYVGHVIVRTPRRLPELLGRRFSREARATPSVGELAERHALAGIDDRALARRFDAAGLELVAHERTFDARFALTRLAFRLLGQPTSFRFIVQRPSS